MAATPSFLSVFDTPTPSEQAAPDWSTWASQVDPFGDRFSYTQNQVGSPLYDYGNISDFSGVSYDPTVTGDPYGAYSTEYGANVINAGIDAYNQQKYPDLFGAFQGNYGTSSNPGVVTNLGGDWAHVDAWNQQIQKAVQDVYNSTGVYVPPNFVKSVMKLESNGNNVNDPYGAVGLMQIMPDIWANNPWGANIYTPEGNILAGVHILADNYQQGDPNDPATKSWEWAAKRYLGLGGSDAYGTTADTYWNTVSANWNQLQNGATSSFDAGGAAQAGTKQFTSIWHNIDAPITQGFGMTDYAQGVLANGNGNSEYDHTKEYNPAGTPIGHAGVDVGVSYGTKLYAPAAGQIEIIGSENGKDFYYTNQGQDNMQAGELAVRMANGDVYILGHMSQILKPDGTQYKVGDTLAPGQFVGYSGTEGTGAHVHVEYRRLTPGATTSGYTAVDPTTAFGGDFSGTYSGTQGLGGPTAAVAPNDWHSFMVAAASGQPLTGKVPLGTGGFHEWLVGKMPGNQPTIADPGSLTPNWVWSGSPNPNGGQGAGAGVQTGAASSIVAEARQFLGAPYVWDSHPSGTAGSKDDPFKMGWDCSAFMVYLDQKYGNGSLPAGSHYQYQYAQQSGKLFTNQSQLAAGDLVFFDTGPDNGGGAELNRAGHVGMYIGNGQIISAMNPSLGTVISNMNAVGGTFIGAMHWGWR